MPVKPVILDWPACAQFVFGDTYTSQDALFQKKMRNVCKAVAQVVNPDGPVMAQLRRKEPAGVDDTDLRLMFMRNCSSTVTPVRGSPSTTYPYQDITRREMRDLVETVGRFIERGRP